LVETAISDNLRKRSRLGAVNIWVLISSACYWAWFDTATFRPTLLMPFDAAAGFHSTYFVVTMTSGALVLIVAALRQKGFEPLLKLKPYGLIAVGVAVAGNLLTMLGAALLSMSLVVVGAVLTGATCSFFLLEWARMYSHEGDFFCQPSPLLWAFVFSGGCFFRFWLFFWFYAVQLRFLLN